MKPNKITIFLLFALINAVVFAQKDIKLQSENNDKISSLFERLDKLNQKDSSNLIPTCNHLQVIDSLNFVIENLKKELFKCQEKNSVIVEPNNSSDDVLLVVIKSFRTLDSAQTYLQDLSKKQHLSIMKNNEETWFHIVNTTECDQKSAGNLVYKYRANGFIDAWSERKKKLKTL